MNATEHPKHPKDAHMKTINIVKADCLDYLPTITTDSVDLVVTDPPYYRVVNCDWDKQWKNQENYLDWLEQVVIELARVLKPTGSIYLFANNYISSAVEGLVARHLKVLNHIVWSKNMGRFKGCSHDGMRKYFPRTERIIFAQSNKPKPFAFEPIRAYLHNACQSAGITNKRANELTNTHMSGHWFGRSQFSFPSKIHYHTLQAHAPNLDKTYVQLKSEYEALKRGINRRYFDMNKQRQYTDVWEFDVVNYYKGKHPCEKPLELLKHMIEASSREGDVVMDVFMGSGSTGVASKQLGRVFAGCEMGNDEFIMAKENINNA